MGTTIKPVSENQIVYPNCEKLNKKSHLRYIDQTLPYVCSLTIDGIAQMTSKCGENKKDCYSPHILTSSEQMHGKM